MLDLQLGTQDGAPTAPDVPPRFTTTTTAYAHSLHHEAIAENDIDGFLSSISSIYSTSAKRWNIPEAVKNTDDLLGPVFSVLSSVLDRFVKPTEPGVERHLVETTSIPECNETDESGYRTFPVLVVGAAGPSFEFPWSDDPDVGAQTTNTILGFARIATYFVVKPEAEAGDVGEVVEEVSFYARPIFRDQPNRLFVRCMVITEASARLVHFDRSGTEITPPFDIHQNPATLIRLVAGLSSANERTIGFDDSVHWTIVDGRKSEGTITMVDSNGQPRTYPIVDEAHKPRLCISGRATTCWRVRDPETAEEYVVKDSWRSEHLPAEHELLELVKDTPGIVHMVSYETGREETKDFRCPSTAGRYMNRVASRTVTKSYGKSIEFFTSAHQAVCAIRDAVAGHRRLVSPAVGILHRHISYNNILLGAHGAPEGQRGILIDLDMAFRETEGTPSAPVNHDIGTRPFQAITVLQSFSWAEPHQPHDYLNEIESFLYLTAYIFLVFKPDGTPLHSNEVGSSVVLKWGADNPTESYVGKRDFFHDSSVAQSITAFIENEWGSACAALVDKFAYWMLDRMDEKRLCWNGPVNRRKEAHPFAPVHAKIDQHYVDVLKMYDEAIEQLKVPPPKSGAPSPSETLPPSHPLLSPSKTVAKIDTTTAAISVEAAPAASPTAASGETTIPLRRSVLRQQVEAKPRAGTRKALPSARSSQASRINPTVQHPEPRRSARIQKRPLEDDELREAPAAKARRTKKASPKYTRSR